MNKEMPISVWQDWKIVEKIGEGSFGKVYKAKKVENGKTYYSAIKAVTIPGNKCELDSVRAEVRDEQEVRDYFRALVDECTEEVMMMVRLHGDSNIVSVEDCKVVEYLDDICWDIFIRMEYLTGFTEYYSENLLTEEDVIRLGIDICRALENCRQRNIIHRDIKPENIFVSETGEFKLGDFGIARQLERTMSGLSKKGTFSYMAPEMYRGEQYDSRVDLYSLGIVLYKLRNHNRLPFLNLNKQLITYRDKENALTRRMSGEQPSVPVDASENLAKIILKACAYRVEDRYAKAEDMREDLEHLLKESQGVPDTAVGQNVVEKKVEASEETQQESEKQEALEEETEKKDNRGKKKQIDRSNQKERKTLRALKPAKKNIKNINEENAEKPRKIRVSPKGKIAISGVVCLIAVFGVLKYKLTTGTLPGLTVTYNYDKQELAKELKKIQERANVITEQLNGYNWMEEPGERIQYFDSSWQLMKVLLYPDATGEDSYEEYFYWYGKCFFVYVWTNDSINYYYYNKDGDLIRWIDSNDVCHDYEISNSEYLERGDKYWDKSVEEMERVQNGLSY